ncbi:MAG: molybdopterin-dependent oxidoreductase [Spirochaetaceae bacterium]|nr:molybdopterin-dependent oxidoreductase [Spirochaetaceae bacterium]
MSDEAQPAKSTPVKKAKSSGSGTASSKKKSAKKITIDSAASFYSDIRPVNASTELLYAYIILSPYSVGKLESVEIKDIPSDYFLLTADKLPFTDSVRTLSTDIPLLAKEKVSYIGEPIAVVVGPDSYVTEQLAKSAVITVIQEEKPETAAEEAAPSVEDEQPEQSDEVESDKTEEQAEAAKNDNSDDRSDETKDSEKPHASQGSSSIALDLKELISSFEDNIKNSALSEAIEKKLKLKETSPDNEVEEQETPQSTATETVDEYIFDSRTFSYGDYLKNYEASDYQVENTFQPQLHFPSVSEPEGAYVEFDGETVTIYTPTLWASHLRKNVASVLNIQEENIHIKRTIVSDSDSNSLWYNTILACLAAVASSMTQKPVLLISPPELSEHINKPVSVSISHKAGVRKDGRITSAIIDIKVHAGAYCPFARQITDSLAAAAEGAYTPDAICVSVKVIGSAEFPAIAGTRNIDTLAFYAVESQMQDIARTTGINPMDLRIQNSVESPDAETGYPIALERQKLTDICDRLLRMSDFNRKYASYSQNPFTVKSTLSTFPSRGMGFAASFDGKGYYGSPMGFLKHTLEVTMEKDGSLTIKSPTPVASIIPVWKRYASEILTISSDQVRFENNDDHGESSELPETITGSVYIMTQLLKKCCQGIQKLRFRQPLPITVRKKLTKPKNQVWDQEKFCGTPYYSTAWGAAAAEVEIDPLLFKPKIRGLWISINAGSILNRKQSEISIRKDINDILRSVMDGSMLSPEKILISFIESQEEPKQLGCLIHSTLPAAIANAIAHALQKTVHTVPVPIDYIYKEVMSK